MGIKLLTQHAFVRSALYCSLYEVFSMFTRTLTMLTAIGTVAAGIYAFLPYHFPSAAAESQTSKGCSGNVIGAGQVTINCQKGPTLPSGCPVGMVYSRTH